MSSSRLLAFLFKFMLMAMAACDRPSTGTQGSPPRCPPGTAPDAARAADIVARLRAVPEGAALLDRSGVPAPVALCFAARASNALTTERAALLEADLPPAEAAARLGHLLAHAADGLPFSDAPTTTTEDCQSRVERAVLAEARGYDIELRLRRALGVENARLAPELEQAWLRAPRGERLSVIATYLKEHPDGAPGMEGIVGGYLKRCQAGTGTGTGTGTGL